MSTELTPGQALLLKRLETRAGLICGMGLAQSLLIIARCNRIDFKVEAEDEKSTKLVWHLLGQELMEFSKEFDL